MLTRGSRRRIELPAARERQRLTFTAETEWQRQHLLDRTADLPEDVLTPARGRTLRVGGYVGLIDTGRLHIELLPRVSPTGSDTEDRQFLLDLLAEARLLPTPRRRVASIAMEGRRLLEVVIRSTAVRMLELLAEGAPRRYYLVDERSSTLRGRLDMRALATRLPSEAHIFPIRHAPLQRENELSRLLASLCAELLVETRDPESRRLLTQCRQHLDVWTGATQLDNFLVDSVVLYPAEAQWEPFVALASALARGRAPHPVESGASAGHGLLFSMDDLFERLLRFRLSKLAAAAGVTLQTQHQRHLLEEIESGRPRVHLRPDYVFRAADGVVALVADAKWKIQPGTGPLRIARADAYQMTAYMLRDSSERGLLLYPGEAGTEHEAAYRIMPAGGALLVATVDVAGLVSRHREPRQLAENWLTSVLVRACSPTDDSTTIPVTDLQAAEDGAPAPPAGGPAGEAGA